MKLFTFVLFAAVALCGSVIFTACSGGAANTATNAPANTTKSNAVPTNTAPANTAPATNANKDVAKTDTAPAGDSVGVPECDEYIKKYEACLTGVAEKNPQIAPSLKTAFEAQRKGFKDAAATPQGKATLSGICKQAIETAKSSTTAYGCAW